MDEQITRKTTVQVPYSFMEHAAKHISCSSLDMYDPKRSHAKVFIWRGKTWTCTGTCSQQKWLQVEIREVVTADRCTGPQHDITKRGPDFYLGGTFKCKNGHTWAMTTNAITLKPDGIPPPAKAEQISFFL
jgi:hypothetical protein